MPNTQTPLSHRICERINPTIIQLLGHPLKLIQVVEYPKCGGTWLARMLRTYLDVERKHGTTHLPKRYSVYQTHLLHNTPYYYNVALIRDPRDVWVSFYFHERYLSQESIYQFDDAASHQENMLAYMQHKFEKPEQTTPSFTYQHFLQSWKDRENTCWIRYEDMHADTAKELTAALKAIGLQPDPARVDAAVKEHEFKNITGRKIGEEDVTSHKRKGIIGDWKNYFTLEMAQLVDQRQAFIYELGYEKDRSWLQDLS